MNNDKVIAFSGTDLIDNPNNIILTEYLCKHVAPEKLFDYSTGIYFDSTNIVCNIELMRKEIINIKRLSVAVILCGIIFGYGTVGLFYLMNKNVPTEELCFLIRLVLILTLSLFSLSLPVYFHIRCWKIPELERMLSMALNAEKRDARD